VVVELGKQIINIAKNGIINNLSSPTLVFPATSTICSQGHPLKKGRTDKAAQAKSNYFPALGEEIIDIAKICISDNS